MAFEPISGWTLALILIMFIVFYVTICSWLEWRDKQKQLEDRVKQLERMKKS
jgi:preprotein translocase subunit YajC